MKILKLSALLALTVGMSAQASVTPSFTAGEPVLFRYGPDSSQRIGATVSAVYQNQTASIQYGNHIEVADFSALVGSAAGLGGFNVGEPALYQYGPDSSQRLGVTILAVYANQTASVQYGNHIEVADFSALVASAP